MDLLDNIDVDVLITDWIKRSRLSGRIDNGRKIGMLVPHRNAIDEINCSGLMSYELTEKQLRLILTNAGVDPYPHS